MTRYDLIHLGQLLFALAVMFGAFLGGLAVGWWRWGRDDESPDLTVHPVRRVEHPVNPGLFTPAEMHESIDLTTSPPAIGIGRGATGTTGVDPFS